MPASSARAVTGTIDALGISVTGDGTAPGVDDTVDGNGIIGTNVAATFAWSITASNLVDGTISQTLPEGWTWVTSSLTNLNSTSAVYSSSYQVTDGGRTLTSTMSVPNSTMVTIPGLKATPANTVPNGSVYTPELIGTDGTGTKTATAAALTVASKLKVLVAATTPSLTTPTRYDFGSGTEKASSVSLGVQVRAVVEQAGSGDPSNLTLPITITLSYDGPVADAVTVNGTSAAYLRVDSVDGNTITLSLLQMPTSTVEPTVSLYYQAAKLPQSEADATNVTYTTSYDAVTAADGSTLLPAYSASRAIPVYYEEKTDPDQLYNASASETIGGYSGTADPVDTLPVGWLPYVDWTTMSSGSPIGNDATTLLSTQYVPAYWRDAGSVGATNLVGYQFWDGSIGTLVGDASDIAVFTAARQAVDPDRYTVQYTAGNTTTDPAANTWVDSVAAAGGADAVQGVRVVLTDPWAVGGTASSATQLLLNLPVQVHTDALGSTTFATTAVWTADGQDTLTREASLAVTPLVVSSLVAPTDVVMSGSDITYLVRQGFGLGRFTPATTDPLVVEDVSLTVTLPSVLTTVDYQDALDQGWTLVSMTDADYGPDGLPATSDDVSGPVLVFEHDPITVSSTTTTMYAFNLIGTTALGAPADRAYANSVLTYSVDPLGDGTAKASGSTRITQLQALAVDGTATPTVIETADTTVQWNANWYNYGASTANQAGYLLDVLPYDGDSRGTSTSATLSLASVELLGDLADSAIEVTSTDPASIGTQGAGATWAPLTADTDMSTVTAVRVATPASGAAGTVRLVLNATGQHGGDVLANSAEAWVGSSVSVSSPSYPVQVVSSTVTGTLWNDADGDGIRGSGENGIGGVLITLVGADGVEHSTRTDAQGGYTLTQLSSGDYTLTADGSTFPNPVLQTAGMGDTLGSGATVSVPQDSTVAEQDFGYHEADAAITLDATGTAPESAKAGDTVTLTFTVTNTGNTPVSEVAVGHGLDAAQSNGSWAWPGTAGTLAAGESATYTVDYTLSQADVDAGRVSTTGTATADYAGTGLTATEQVAVSFDAAAAMTSTVTGVLDGAAKAGAGITWSATLTNTGAVTLSGLTGSDGTDGTDGTVTWTDVPTSLAPGESVTVTGTSTLTQAQVDAGSASGAITATAEQATSTGSGAVTFAPESTVTVDLTVNGEHQAAPGLIVTDKDALTWSATVTNTGDTTLTGITLADADGLTGITLADRTLAPGESAVVTGTTTAALGEHTGTVTVTAVGGPDGATITATDAATYTAEPISASSITGQVRADLDGDGELTADEPGIAGVTVTLSTGATTTTDADGTYRFGGLVAGDYTVTVDRSTVNAGRAAVTVSPAGSDSAAVTVAESQALTGVDFGYDLLESGMSVTAELTPLPADPIAGDPVTITYTITNTGENTLTDLGVDTALAGAELTWTWPGTPGELAPGESVTVVVSSVLTEEQVAAGTLAVAGTATGTDIAAETVTASADVSAELVTASAVTVSEVGVLAGEAVVGGTVTWTATVTNTGPATLTGVSLGEGWTLDCDGTLAPGASATATATSVLTQADLDAHLVGSQVTVTAITRSGATLTAAAQAEVQVPAASAIGVRVLIGGQEYPTGTGAAVTTGDELEVSAVITNTGATTLTGITLSDEVAWQLPAGFTGTLAPGESLTVTATQTAAAGSHTLTVTATGTEAGSTVTGTGTAVYTATDRVHNDPPKADPPPTGNPPHDPPPSTIKKLAITGAGVGGAGLFALLLVGLGALLRRRASRHEA